MYNFEVETPSSLFANEAASELGLSERALCGEDAADYVRAERTTAEQLEF